MQTTGPTWTHGSTVAPSGVHGRTFNKLARVVLATVARFVRDPDEADELGQRILLEIYEKRIGLHPDYLAKPAAIIPHVRTALRNDMIDAAAAVRARTTYEDEYARSVEAPRLGSLTPDNEAEMRHIADAVEHALASMTEDTRNVYLQVREKGDSYKDAAANLGMTERKVKRLMKRAHAILRLHLDVSPEGSAGGKL